MTFATGEAKHESEEVMRRAIPSTGKSTRTFAICGRYVGPSVLFLLLSAVTFAPAFAETGRPPNRQAVRRGAPLYKKYFQTCHGERGVGEQLSFSASIRGELAAPALDDSQHAWHHSDDDLVAFILRGSPRTQRMPAWRGTLSKKQVRDIVAYIKSLWGPRAIECQGPKHMSCM